MRYLHLLCLTAAVVVSGCSVADSDRLPPRPETTGVEVNGASDGSLLDESGAASECVGVSCELQISATDAACVAYRVPATGAPRVDDGPAVAPIYFGLTEVYLGERNAQGKADDDAWLTHGIDIDGLCTNAMGCSQYETPARACAPLTQRLIPDAPHCVDNVFSYLQGIAAKVPELGSTYGLNEASINCSLRRGSYNWIVRLSGYNGEENDPEVRLDFYSSPGLEMVQRFDCPVDDLDDDQYPQVLSSRRWLVAEQDLAPTSDEATFDGWPDSRHHSDHGYVLDGLLVAELPADLPLKWPRDQANYPGWTFKFSYGYYVAQLRRGADRIWAIDDGMVVGAFPLADMAASFATIGVCPQGRLESVANSMVTYMQEAADLLASGAIDPDAPCDALSTTVRFTATQVTPGEVRELQAEVNCCDPALARDMSCPFRCGDRRVTVGENCDVGIPAGEPGSCPESCVQDDPCVLQSLRGRYCDATCEALPVESQTSGDGCCLPGATASNDSDCEALCGDGVVTGAETCDPPESCPSPTECRSPDACLIAQAVGSAAGCDAACEFAEVTECLDGDDCCPYGCNVENDDDCPAPDGCGNGVIDPGEFCDGDCPTSCGADRCSGGELIGSADRCTARCIGDPATGCNNGDGCCLEELCNALNDSDCAPMCGNGVVEGDEECDPGLASLATCENCRLQTRASACELRLMEVDGLEGAECAACACRFCEAPVDTCLSDALFDRCEGVLSCTMENHCQDVLDCYCGGDPLCYGLGPCGDAVLRATAAPDFASVQNFARIPDHPLGQAVTATECMANNCAATCDLR